MNKEDILSAITDFYLNSPDFNGMPVSNLCEKYSIDKEHLASILSEMLKDELITIVYPDCQANPHVRFFYNEPLEKQIEKLKSDKFDSACIYPLRKHLEKVVDINKYAGKPFELELALGSPSVDFRYFELAILEIYREDPRYYYTSTDIDGKICIKDEFYESEKTQERDKVLIERFGYCYDENNYRGVVAFLCDLAKLSPEHQQIWNSKRVEGQLMPHPDFFRTMILGEWAERISICDALVWELEIINKMCEAIGWPRLFNKDYSGDNKPPEFGFLIRPTLKEFNRFAKLLNVIIADNINKDFFRNKIALEFKEELPDGSIKVIPKGTLTLLEEWLRKNFKPKDKEPFESMFKAFKKVNEIRGRDAHVYDENEFDVEYYSKQREIIKDVYNSVRLIRLALANHPKARKVEVPDVLFEGKIWDK